MRGLFGKVAYLIRNFKCRPLFGMLRAHCAGSVLDIGGWDFYLTARRRGVPHTNWTTLEPDANCALGIEDERFRLVEGDGCSMPFNDGRFETVLCIQVLEHVFEPIRMVQEIARVLQPGGCAIILVPQTANLHLAPYHYQNFTRFWLLSAMERAQLQIVELLPLGGAWSTIAARLLYLLLQSRSRGKLTHPEATRNVAFYLLLPFMWLFAIICIPICLFLSLGDLVEEPNNHLCVARKPTRQRIP